MCKKDTENDKETGKCKKAKLRIGHATEQVRLLKPKMKDAFEMLGTIIGKAYYCPDEENAQLKDCPRIVFPLENLPIKFYIDFRIVVEEDELLGAIIYGALRTPRYPYILQAKALKLESEIEWGPLVQFLVDDQGRIRGSGKMDDEWWLPDDEEKDGNAMVSKKDRNAMISEMHHRAIDLIWRRALTWGNEGLLA